MKANNDKNGFQILINVSLFNRIKIRPYNAEFITIYVSNSREISYTY